METYLVSDNYDDFLHFISSWDLELGKWGTLTYKSVNQLYKELINNDSAILYNDATKEIIREVSALFIDILHIKSNGKSLRLKEDIQEFKDGRVRRRDKEYAVSEKLKTDESPSKGLKRALSEELSIHTPVKTHFVKKDIKIEESLSYPGLITKYNIYIYEVELSEAQFNEKGYIEFGDDITTTFTWVEKI